MLRRLIGRQRRLIQLPALALVVTTVVLASQAEPAAAAQSFYNINPSCGYGRSCVLYGSTGPGGIWTTVYGISGYGTVISEGGAYCPYAQGCRLTTYVPADPIANWVSAELRTDSYGSYFVHTCGSEPGPEPTTAQAGPAAPQQPGQVVARRPLRIEVRPK